MSTSFLESMESRRMFTFAAVECEPLKAQVEVFIEQPAVCVKPLPSSHAMGTRLTAVRASAGQLPGGSIFSDIGIDR